MFVIAFLIIIYSQITGSGLNNYGIKRMLPRLIVAAIAVNLSFFICQIMVDLSNIMGFAIKEFLSNEAARLGPSVLGGASQGADTQTSGGILASISSKVLIAGGLVWLFLGPFFLIVTTVIITAVTVILILLLRKAILVILVVVSPIAFVMYLLPNTEKLFSKWLNMFWGLLMVFPVVASLFGGGQLASTIILMAGAGKTTPPTTNSEQCSAQQEKDAANKTQKQKDDDAVKYGYSVPCEGVVALANPSSPDQPVQAGWMLGLVATGIAVAPLLAVWAVLKGALAAAGAIGGKIAANVQKGSQKGVGGGLNKAKGMYEKSTLGQMRARDKKIRDIDIKAGTYEGKGKNFNPRNVRSRVNSRLNNAGKY
ncbi:MAG: ABC transporter ATP-binding protein, partial [Moraxellaceae bacterium]